MESATWAKYARAESGRCKPVDTHEDPRDDWIPPRMDGTVSFRAAKGKVGDGRDVNRRLSSVSARLQCFLFRPSSVEPSACALIRIASAAFNDGAFGKEKDSPLSTFYLFPLVRCVTVRNARAAVRSRTYDPSASGSRTNARRMHSRSFRNERDSRHESLRLPASAYYTFRLRFCAARQRAVCSSPSTRLLDRTFLLRHWQFWKKSNWPDVQWKYFCATFSDSQSLLVMFACNVLNKAQRYNFLSYFTHNLWHYGQVSIWIVDSSSPVL